MLDLDAWKEIAASLARNKLRTFLTACGVFWGIFVLIVMLGLGDGLQRGTERNLGDLATRSVFVWSQRTSMPFKGLQPGRYVRFRNADIEAIHGVPGVDAVAPRIQLGGWRDGNNVAFGAKTANFSVLGDYPSFEQVEAFEVRKGRFINSRDLDEARKVCVIGDEVQRVLFGETAAIGKYLMIQGVYFQVVGEVSSDKAGDQGERIRSSVFVPFSTFQRAFNQRDRVGWFALTASDDAPAEEVEASVRALLAARHKVDPRDEQALGSFNAAKEFGRVQGLFRGIRGFVWLVGILTLLSGVLGVSNILLITVKERTREIGVRKALGATPRAIVGMILKEAVALTSLAGYLGLVAGVAVLELLTVVVEKLPNAPLNRPEVDLSVALGAALVLVVSGAIAGIVPAHHAARISPVEALRAE